MRRTIAVCALVLVGTLWSATLAQVVQPGKEFDKTGQAGMTFLKIGPLAGPAGVGDAYTGMSFGAASAFYNPAGLGYLDGKFDAVVSRVNWIADIGISSAAVGIPLRIGSAGRVGVIGVSVVSMDYGDIYGTAIQTAGTKGYRDVGMLQPTESALGLTFARQFTDKFSVGITMKYVSQELPWYSAKGELVNPTPIPRAVSVSLLAFDGGTLYRTGFGSSVISMSIRNYARAQKYVNDRFLLPMTFSIGVATDAFDLAPGLQQAGHKLMVSGDGIHPPDHPEKFAVGAEYSYKDMVFLRCGSSFKYDSRKGFVGLKVYGQRIGEHGFDVQSVGFGIRYTLAGVRGGFDYAYTNFSGGLGTVNYITLSFGM